MMMNFYTMLRQFPYQTNESIFDFFAKLKEYPDVCSAHMNMLESYCNESKVYMFASTSQIVFVSVETNKCGTNEWAEEISEEKMFEGAAPMYSSGDMKRVSPVWSLKKMVNEIKWVWERGESSCPKISCVLLTDSHIRNASMVSNEWERQHVTVLFNLKNLDNYAIPLNDNREVPGYQYVKTLVDTMFPDYSPSFAIEPVDVHNLDKDENDDEKAGGSSSYNLFVVSGVKDRKIDDDKEEDDDELDDDDDDFDDSFGELLDSFDDDDDDDEGETYPSGIVRLGPSTVRVQVLKPMENPREELNKLVGCKGIKERIDELITLNEYNQMMQKVAPLAKLHNISLHSIFIGKPGTGKTTVCKIFGSLLKEAGVLSKGHVVVANRSAFIGGVWGDEEKMVRALIKMAQGGVLMIDEAYQLNGNHSQDPGKLVIPLFMDLLADESQRDIAVVLCGYKKEMGRLLELNPGLNSRFPNTFDFPDFSFEELLAITLQRVKEYHYKFTRSAWAKYKSILNAAYQVRDPQTWGNARFVANLLEHIYLLHAKRCVRLKNPNVSRLMMITVADVEPIDVPTPKGHIGF